MTRKSIYPVILFILSLAMTVAAQGSKPEKSPEASSELEIEIIHCDT